MQIELSITELRCLREHIKDYDPVRGFVPADIANVRDKIDRAIAHLTAIPVTFGTPAPFQPVIFSEMMKPNKRSGKCFKPYK